MPRRQKRRPPAKSRSVEISLAPRDADEVGRKARQAVPDEPEVKGWAVLQEAFLGWECGVHRGREQSREAWDDLWGDIGDAFAGETLSRFQAIDVGMPILRRGVETLKNRLLSGLMPDERWFRFIPVQEEDEDGARAMTAYVRDALREGMFEREMLDGILDDFVAFGTAIVEPTWEERVQETVSRDLKDAEDLDSETGEGKIVQIEVETRRTRVLESRPAIRRVNLRQFYPDRAWNVSSVEDLSSYAITSAPTWADLYRLRRRDETDVLNSGIEEKRRVGRFAQVPTTSESSLVNADGSSDGDGAQGDMRGESDEKGGRVDGFRMVTAHYADLNLEEVFRSSEREIGKADKREFLEMFDLEESDLKPGGGRWVAEYLPDHGMLLSLRKNPMPLDLPCHEVVSFFPRKDCLFGIGVYEYLWSMQKGMNLVASNVTDAVERITDPMYAGKTSDFDSRTGGMEEVIEWDGGRFIGLSSSASGGNPLQVVAPPENIVAVGVSYLQYFEDALIRLLGIEPHGGEVGGARATAEEVRTVVAGANDLLRSQIRRVESQLLLPALEKIRRLVQSILRESQAVTQLGEDGTEVPLLITPDEPFQSASMRARALGSTELFNKMARAQELSNIGVQWVGTGYLKIPRLLEEIFRLKDIRVDIDEFVHTAESLAQGQIDAARLAQRAGPLSLPAGEQSGEPQAAGAAPILTGEGDMAASGTGGAL